MAKKNGKLMTDPELAAATGWGLGKLHRIYNSATWDNITNGDMDTFLKACGLTTFSLRKARWLMKLAVARGGLHTMQHLNGKKTGGRQRQFKLHLERIEKLLSQ